MKYLIFSAFRYMHESTGIKRPSIPAGNTPDKPWEKSRRGHGKARKPLFVNPPQVSPVSRVSWFYLNFCPLNTYMHIYSICTFLQVAVLTPLNKRSRPRRGYIKSPVKYHKWSFDEDRALVEFVSISWTDPKYNFSKPYFRASHVFWRDAARHIREATSSNFLLTSKYSRLCYSMHS